MSTNRLHFHVDFLHMTFKPHDIIFVCQICIDTLSVEWNILCAVDRRAALYVPGNDEGKIKKIPSLNVDCVILDCEDGVAMNRKVCVWLSQNFVVWPTMSCFGDWLKCHHSHMTVHPVVYWGVYAVYQPPGFFWQHILTSVIINKQGTFRPFATPLCVYPLPFLAIHHCVHHCNDARSRDHAPLQISLTD